MIAYLEVRPMLDYLLTSGLVTKIYQDVIIWENGENKYPAYKVGDEYYYIGVDDSKKMVCYIRQTGPIRTGKAEWNGSCSKTYESVVPYRVVFFNDWEERSFEDLQARILQSVLFRRIDLVSFINDADQLLSLETIVKNFSLGGKSFYCAIDITVKFDLKIDNCDVSISCDNLPNPLESRAPVVYKNLNELDPVWNSEKQFYFTKNQVLALIGQAAIDEEGAIPLVVVSNGQTQFNIFTEPPNDQHYLSVNGAEYNWENGDYEIQQVGLNWKLIWLNTEFSLDTEDELLFVKY